jgi:hypothetical protein
MCVCLVPCCHQAGEPVDLLAQRYAGAPPPTVSVAYDDSGREVLRAHEPMPSAQELREKGWTRVDTTVDYMLLWPRAGEHQGEGDSEDEESSEVTVSGVTVKRLGTGSGTGWDGLQQVGPLSHA